MFDYVWDVPIGYVLCGVIWSLACGFAVGNYACSLVHRLPRGRLVLEKPPYCGTCGTLLATKDLFPVFSAMLLRHRCRYCKTPFPVSHTWTELLVGVLFVLAFFQYGYGEHFVMIAFIGVFFITLAAIEANEGIIFGKIILCITVCGLIYRAMLDGGIYNVLEAGLYSLLFSALLWRKQVKKVGHIYVLPPQALLLIAGAMCVGAASFSLFAAILLGLSVVFYLWSLLRHAPFRLSMPVGLATTITILYPSINIY